MKVTFVNANGIEYMAQYDHENIFVTKKDESQREKFLIIQIFYGEVVLVKTTNNKTKEIIEYDIDTSKKYDADVHDLIKHYANLLER